jgi:hypothetical protein
MKLTTHLHQVLKSMYGAIPSLPQYILMVWCLVKAKGQLYLYLFTFDGKRYVLIQVCMQENYSGNLIAIPHLFSV